VEERVSETRAVVFGARSGKRIPLLEKEGWLRWKRSRDGHLREIWLGGSPRRFAPSLLFKEGSFALLRTFYAKPVTVGTLVVLLGAGHTAEEILKAYCLSWRWRSASSLTYAALRSEDVDIPFTGRNEARHESFRGYSIVFRESQSLREDLRIPWRDALLVFHGVAKAFHLNPQLTKRIDSH
jgi:hypothetical protein